MAALIAGVQYGLSSHHNFYENKSLVFVKLTDSAQRAIEDYLCNRNKVNKNPTIQFLGNEGQLSFPSTKSKYGNFTFSLFNNQDIEGPQGGFECVQQVGPKNLESLGTLPCKMRIQANDDVYETTKHRMHIAEENNKNKCTRVIKGNEPIGRKVKVKGLIKTIPPHSTVSHSASSISLRHRELSRLSSCNNPTFKLASSNSLSTQISINRLQHDLPKKVPDIMRRPLKERLTHLLALRAFKRPELYDRINREGIREKEKNIIATVLKQIAFMRDNTYHLYRCMWNDVQEEWPFYTEQEKAMLKRRKPQNLTPPGSSDSSSGSGQSPNSTHPGSPPIISVPLGVTSTKRPGYYQGNDGLPTKRQRISHYRKPETLISINSGDSGKLNLTSDNSNSCPRKIQQRQQHHQQYDQQQGMNCISVNYDIVSTSDNEEMRTEVISTINKSIASTCSLSNNIKCNMNMFLDDNNYQCQQLQQQQQYKVRDDDEQLKLTSEEKIENDDGANSNINISQENTVFDLELNLSHLKGTCEEKSEHEKSCEVLQNIQCNSTRSNYSWADSSSIKTTHYSETSIVGNSFLNFPADCNSVPSARSEFILNSECPDYLTYYTKISSSEQRTHYKSEFNSYYKEYRKLHIQVVKISKQFSLLEGQLREKSESGNMEGYEAIKKQILQEYAKTKNVNARFYYLHDKLGHIKKLVSDYDAQNHAGSILYNNLQNTSGSKLNINSLLNDTMETQCTFTHLPIDTIHSIEYIDSSKTTQFS